MATPIGEYVTEIARFFPRQGKWDEEHYFALPETNDIVELVDGVIIVAPAPDQDHQYAAVQLVTVLNLLVRKENLGVVLMAPFDVRLAPNLVRQPDVLFIREEHRDRIRNGILYGAPDWAAEIISPSSGHIDQVEKLEEYAAAGIPEYWLLDPKAKSIRVYALRGSDTYTLIGTYTPGDTAKSETLPGFEVEVSSIFA
jgi:Uma2 family endonuclease